MSKFGRFTRTSFISFGICSSLFVDVVQVEVLGFLVLGINAFDKESNISFLFGSGQCTAYSLIVDSFL